MYAAVAFTGYAYIGSDVSGFITNVLPFGSLYRSSAFFLFLHMIITYLVKGTVVARALHYQIDKARINDTDLTSRFEYFSITLIVMICAYLLAMIIPFFDLLTALIGSCIFPFSMLHYTMSNLYESNESARHEADVNSDGRNIYVSHVCRHDINLRNLGDDCVYNIRE